MAVGQSGKMDTFVRARITPEGYLGLHLTIGVLGAMVEGLAWLAFCLTAGNTVRRRKRL